MQVIKRLFGGLVFLSFALVLACASQKPAIQTVPASDPAASVDARYTGDGVSLDEALSDIAAYYTENLPANTKIALIDFESDARLLSDYILEELWIRFEDSASFTLVDRRNLDLIRKELKYQHSGNVSEESAQSVGRQFGAQTLVYGKITRLGGEYRLVVHATDVERAVASIRSAQVRPDPRFAAILENPSGGAAGANMANALYSGVGNPWRFTAQTDRSDGEYHDGDYMTLQIYSERDAWFKITHIDVHGDAQVIYPVSPRDNNFIRAGETRRIPDNTRFRMTTPYGEEMILVGAYEKRFVIQKHTAAPLSNSLLVRGITVEREDTRTDIRPVATARFTYRIGP
ncbi:MAG: DUF4384 domain-containing protein [Treponema sp.]|jgi:hypothetical protein|nr:DUF4384 domain-containing protein [Treponema sp.]